MGRNILAAAGGYVVMVIVVFAGIGIAWALLGASGAFAGDTPSPSTTWLAGNLISGFVAAFAGGWTARRIGKSTGAVSILIGFILVLGVVSAVFGPDPPGEPLGKPVADLTFIEAGQYAVQPTWYNWIVPIIGAVAAWLGGRGSDKR